MSLDPAQLSTDEIEEIPSKIIDDPSTMDLMSLIFRSLELRDEKNSRDDVADVGVKDRRSMHADDKSSSNERRRYRRKVTDDDLIPYIDANDKTLDVISLDQLAWHDSADDCWVAIYDYVYDCTKFVGRHPGGQDVLLEYAGRDATLAFIGSGHSAGTRKILEKYLIGELPACERIFRIVDGVKIVQQ